MKETKNEIVNRNARYLKGCVGLALGIDECTEIIENAVNEAFSLKGVVMAKQTLCGCSQKTAKVECTCETGVCFLKHEY